MLIRLDADCTADNIPAGFLLITRTISPLELLMLSQRQRGKTCIIKSPAVSFPETAKPRFHSD